MDDKNIEVELDEAIFKLLKHIDTLPVNSEERKEAVTQLNILYKLREESIRDDKAFQKDCELAEQGERELELKAKELEGKKLERVAKYVEIGITVTVTTALALVGLKFEKMDSFASPIAKGLFNRGISLTRK